MKIVRGQRRRHSIPLPREGPRVRIHLPPAVSQQTFGFLSRRRPLFDRMISLPSRRVPEGVTGPSPVDGMPRLAVVIAPKLERERLLAGNWKIRPAAGLNFNLSKLAHRQNQAANCSGRCTRSLARIQNRSSRPKVTPTA